MQVSFGAQQILEQLHDYLTRRFEEYAMQWSGDMYPSPCNFMSAKWTWTFCFGSVGNAMRFVLGTQFGLRLENWQEDFLAWFPGNEYSADGQLTFRGPRVTMLVHAASGRQKEGDGPGDAGSEATPPSILNQPSDTIMAVKKDPASGAGYDMGPLRTPHCCAVHPRTNLHCLGPSKGTIKKLYFRNS